MQVQGEEKDEDKDEEQDEGSRSSRFERKLPGSSPEVTVLGKNGMAPPGLERLLCSLQALAAVASRASLTGKRSLARVLSGSSLVQVQK